MADNTDQGNSRKRSAPRKAKEKAPIVIPDSDDDVVEVAAPPSRKRARTAPKAKPAVRLDKDFRVIEPNDGPSAAPAGVLPVVQTPRAPAVGPTPSPTKKRARGKNTAVANPDEERPGRFRSVANAAVRDRIKRAMGQTMYVVNRTVVSDVEQSFAVLGSVGNVYAVKIRDRPNCTCPDYAKHGGNETCKHILMVLGKALKIAPENALIWQVAYTGNELREIFQNSPDPAAMATAKVRKAYAQATGMGGEDDEDEKAAENDGRRHITEEDDCPVCYDSLFGVANNLLEWCTGCGNSLHKACLTQWKDAQRRAGKTVTCVYCRKDWVDAAVASTAGGKIAGGYVNLAAVAGLSGRRDTSSCE